MRRVEGFLGTVHNAVGLHVKSEKAPPSEGALVGSLLG